MEKEFHSFSFGSWYAAQLRYLIVETEHVWREVRAPGADISDLPQEVQDEIGEKWTPELLSAYQNWLTNEDPKLVVSPKTLTPKQQRLLNEVEAVQEPNSDMADIVLNKLRQ